MNKKTEPIRKLVSILTNIDWDDQCYLYDIDDNACYGIDCEDCPFRSKKNLKKTQKKY